MTPVDKLAQALAEMVAAHRAEQAGEVTPLKWLTFDEDSRAAVYMDGYKRGVEDAAAVCDDLKQVGAHSSTGTKRVAAAAMATSCAQLIRALIKDANLIKPESKNK